MMRLLTGASTHEPFEFVPLYVQALENTVLVEGCDKTRSVFWVHAWTVSPDGIITQVREYFNTSLTVTQAKQHCLPIWRSRLPERAGKSLPGLVLAI
ncbi:hypothetical protein J5N97_013806 [Dioscorea zingiberensis]|uniref:Wound-induced protein 1 n=1 Tax=Dioscorea zingiberensis TaxID=325984 RepID=A0A9D5HJF4_9LILI|nr:hypothetical protein J5N97_013806 [Dioscorea zingiberensis]